MNTDLSIARSVTPKPIEQVAADLGLQPDELWLYGTSKAKVLRSSLVARKNGVGIPIPLSAGSFVGEED